MLRYAKLAKGALCVGMGKDFFPDNGRPKTFMQRQLCPVCPVRELCLEHALESPLPPSGVWGGMDQEEVQAMWMARQRGIISRRDEAC